MNANDIAGPHTDDTDEKTYRLIYRSRSLIPEQSRKEQLGDIFRVARPNNTSHAVSGALLLYGDWFAQTLEGDEETVRELFSRIEKDSRHESVEILEAGPVAGKVFSRWAMAQVGEHHEHDIPLIANTAGITEASDRGTTSEQELVLDRMRDATRGFGKGF